jgi:hypothetical protein
MVEMNQKLVDQYFKGWVDMAVYNTEDYAKGPSCLIMEFRDMDSATSSYEFVREWKRQNEHFPFSISIIQERSSTFTIYLYKKGRGEFVKGTFDVGQELPQVEKFVKMEKDRTYALLPRFTDKNGARIDSYTQDVLLLKGFKFKQRQELTASDFEHNK